MTNRYLALTLLIASCGLQIYLVDKGCMLFLELDAVFLPFWLKSFSSYLFAHYLMLPYYLPAILILALPALTTILSWVFLGLRRKFGWNLALVTDLYFALPSLALVSMQQYDSNLLHSPEVLLIFLALLHIVMLCLPPIRTLIFPHSATPDSNNKFIRPIAPAR